MGSRYQRWRAFSVLNLNQNSKSRKHFHNLPSTALLHFNCFPLRLTEETNHQSICPEGDLDSLSMIGMVMMMMAVRIRMMINDDEEQKELAQNNVVSPDSIMPQQSAKSQKKGRYFINTWGISMFQSDAIDGVKQVPKEKGKHSLNFDWVPIE